MLLLNQHGLNPNLSITNENENTIQKRVKGKFNNSNHIKRFRIQITNQSQKVWIRVNPNLILRNLIENT